MLRVLMVDDHYNFCLAVRLILESVGHAVILAGDGEEALLQLDANPVDLLITDMEMPRMDGLALTAEVRQRYPAVVILAISGDPELGISALNAGAHLFLTKPFAYHNLVEAVHKLFGSLSDEPESRS